MAILPIITAPDPKLKQRCQPVGAVDDEVRRLADDMLETMYQAPGIGLAAPQVGVLRRIIVVDVARPNDGEAPAPHCLINPELIWTSDDARAHEEGCLSLPDHYAEVVRPERIRVGFVDREGERQEMEANGLLATCIQHEMDHLEGILFVDHLSGLRRSMILRKLTKAKRGDKPLAKYATA
jgi:peptide deformylase